MRRAALFIPLLLLAACDGASAPGFANVDGSLAAADLATSENVISPAVLDLLTAAAAAIDSTTGAGLSASTALLGYAGPRSGTAALHTARLLVSSGVGPVAGPSISLSLSSLEGRTLVYDVDSASYVVSDETGAPAGAVRFVLYQAAEGAFVQPLARVGFVDIAEKAAAVVELAVTVAGTERLRYATQRVAESGGVHVTIDGTTPAALFAMDAASEVRSASELAFDMSYRVEEPARRHQVTVNLVADLLTGIGRQNLGVSLASAKTDVALSGELDESGRGTLAARSRGVTFALVVRSDSSLVVTAPDGAGYDPGGAAFLKELLASADRSLTRFDLLRQPVLGLVNR